MAGLKREDVGIGEDGERLRSRSTWMPRRLAMKRSSCSRLDPSDVGQPCVVVSKAINAAEGRIRKPDALYLEAFISLEATKSNKTGTIGNSR